MRVSVGKLVCGSIVAKERAEPLPAFAGADVEEEQVSVAACEVAQDVVSVASVGGDEGLPVEVFTPIEEAVNPRGKSMPGMCRAPTSAMYCTRTAIR